MSINQREKAIYPSNIIQERALFQNGYLLLLSQYCPQATRVALQELVSQQGSDWFKPYQRVQWWQESRREIFLPPSSDMAPRIIVKRKKVVEADEEKPFINFYTQSTLHEMRTSLFLREILEKYCVSKKITYSGKEYAVHCKVQSPWGAIINTNDRHDRYGIFEFVSAESARDFTKMNDGWNNLDQYKRSLFAQIHVMLNELSNLAVKAGLHPWDLGVHQVLYSINDSEKKIVITIIDTEEYVITSQHKADWPQQYSEVGLPPVLLFL